jgi:hypothetical protein
MTSQKQSSMEKQPQQPEHCNHECVCQEYILEKRNWHAVNQKCGDPCNHNLTEEDYKCQHDTRSQPTHPCAPDPSIDCFWQCKHYKRLQEEVTRAITLAARKDTIRELLRHFKFNCPGESISPICDMCNANPYCIELRQQQESDESIRVLKDGMKKC